MKIHKSYFLIIALVIGVYISYLICGVICNIIPSEFKRTKLVINTLKKDHKPNTIFLGNSVGMNGLNARLINQKEKGKIYAYNLCTVGQRLSESFLYYQEISPNIKTVVQLVTVPDLSDSFSFVPDIYTVYYMYSYRPDLFTKTSLNSIFGEQTAEVFNKSDFFIKFDSRKTIINLPNTIMRKALRKDLNLDAVDSDIFYPSPYTKNVPEKEIQKEINKSKLNKFQLTPQKYNLLKVSQAFFKSKNIRYVVLVAPFNPMYNYSPSFLNSIEVALKELNNSGIITINCSQLLKKDDFIDHIHPNKKGADILSTYVSNTILE